jgi:predicted ATPase
VVDLLETYFDIIPEDDARRRREKIAGKILMLDRALEDTLPYFLTLLEVAESDDLLARMDPEIRRRRTLDAIKRLLIRESLHQPLIVIFEDLHWLDEGSRALLNLLADSIGTARVLMLVNYRPEFTHNWGNKTYYTQLRLDPLGAESGEEMLKALLDDGADLVALKRVIIEKTEGNPFFMEEIVQALFEQGALLRNGSVKLGKSLSTIQLPSTVQAVLASRVDRLPPDEKELLQTLAVIGKEFPLRLVREVSGKAEDELQRMLSDLQGAEFIYEQPAISEVGYVFKHALSQQVASGSALLERRTILHERIAHVLEAQFPETVDTQTGADRPSLHKPDWGPKQFRIGNEPVSAHFSARQTWKPSITLRRDSSCSDPDRTRLGGVIRRTKVSVVRSCWYLVKRNGLRANTWRLRRHFWQLPTLPERPEQQRASRLLRRDSLSP